MNVFQHSRLALKRMPFVLRIVTQMLLILILFLPASLMPFGEHSIDGQLVTFVEFWKQGGGPVFALLGIVASTLAYGFIRARFWSRPVSILCFLGFASITIWEDPRMNAENLIIAIGVVVLWPGYLYLSKRVRRYFSEAPQL